MSKSSRVTGHANVETKITYRKSSPSTSIRSMRDMIIYRIERPTYIHTYRRSMVILHMDPDDGDGEGRRNGGLQLNIDTVDR
jgi:hypothetical protein